MASKSVPISTPNIIAVSKSTNLAPSVSKLFGTSKKKDSKSEKSIETTLEKLTQHRHKELTGKHDNSEENKSVIPDGVTSDVRKNSCVVTHDISESPTNISKRTNRSTPSVAVQVQSSGGNIRNMDKQTSEKQNASQKSINLGKTTDLLESLSVNSESILNINILEKVQSDKCTAKNDGKHPINNDTLQISDEKSKVQISGSNLSVNGNDHSDNKSSSEKGSE